MGSTRPKQVEATDYQVGADGPADLITPLLPGSRALRKLGRGPTPQGFNRKVTSSCSGGGAAALLAQHLGARRWQSDRQIDWALQVATSGS